MQDATGGGASAHIRGLMPSLAPAERRVADAVVADPGGASRLSITELATACDTSETTVVRFCRAVGFTGYRQLRLSLAVESGRRPQAREQEVGGDIAPDDDLAQVVAKVAFTDARAIEETAEQLDLEVLGAVADAIAAAPRIELFGVGASSVVTADLEQKLRRIGRMAHACSDPHLAMTSAAVLVPGDVAVGVSHTGTTRDTVDPLGQAAERGATTVAITNFPRSAITEAVDHVLTTAARETTFRSGAMASRLAQLTVVDCLLIAVAQRTYLETRGALELTLESVRGRRYGDAT